jgi:hypothetical protein
MAHLPSDTPTLQLIAYVSLTLASVTVALTSLFMAYRQNFGWKPILFIISVGGGRGARGHSVTTEFEFWNRKKYPINITFVSVDYSKTRIARGGNPPLSDGWGINGEHRIFNENRMTIKPTENKYFQTVTPIDTSSVLDISENVTISVFYFDPIKNRIMCVVVDTEHTINLEGMSKFERFKRRMRFWR